MPKGEITQSLLADGGALANRKVMLDDGKTNDADTLVMTSLPYGVAAEFTMYLDWVCCCCKEGFDPLQAKFDPETTARTCHHGRILHSLADFLIWNNDDCSILACLLACLHVRFGGEPVLA